MEVAPVPAAPPVGCTPRRELRLSDLTRHLACLTADAVVHIFSLARSKPGAITFHEQRTLRQRVKAVRSSEQPRSILTNKISR